MLFFLFLLEGHAVGKRGKGAQFFSYYLASPFFLQIYLLSPRFPWLKFGENLSFLSLDFPPEISKRRHQPNRSCKLNHSHHEIKIQRARALLSEPIGHCPRAELRTPFFGPTVFLHLEELRFPRILLICTVPCPTWYTGLE